MEMATRGRSYALNLAEVKSRYAFCQKDVHRSTTSRDPASPGSLRKLRAWQDVRRYSPQQSCDKTPTPREALPPRESRDPPQEGHWSAIARTMRPALLPRQIPMSGVSHPELTKRLARVAEAEAPIPAIDQGMWRIGTSWNMSVTPIPARPKRSKSDSRDISFEGGQSWMSPRCRATTTA